MSYKKLFNPTGLEDLLSKEKRTEKCEGGAIGDRRDGKIYVYDDGDEIVLAVNIALATGRPLLLSGCSGGGKSSLAHHVARVLGRCYYEFVVTARTQAQDLTWRFDAIRRLADAGAEEYGFARTRHSDGSTQTESQEKPAERQLSPGNSPSIRHAPKSSEAYLESIYPYIEPQELWWIFNRESARRRGRPELDPKDEPRDPCKWDPSEAKTKGEWVPGRPQRNSSVLLIDEIDKADPDVPNNLLVELGSMQFTVDVIGETVSFQGAREDWRVRPLVIITTNKERPLPLPFLRRCIVLEIPKPKRGLLWDIAAKNFPGWDQAFFDTILEAVSSDRDREPSGEASGGSGTEQTGQEPATGPAQQAPNRSNDTVEISIAEYLDTVRACISLQTEKGKPKKPNPKLLADIVTKTRWIAKQEAVRS
jgi:MoxR-like ATPase